MGVDQISRHDHSSNAEGGESISPALVSVSRSVPSGEERVIPSGRSTVVSGGLTVDGVLEVNGLLTDITGPITGSGTLTGDGETKVLD